MEWKTHFFFSVCTDGDYFSWPAMRIPATSPSSPNDMSSRSGDSDYEGDVDFDGMDESGAPLMSSSSRVAWLTNDDDVLFLNVPLLSVQCNGLPVHPLRRVRLAQIAQEALELLPNGAVGNAEVGATGAGVGGPIASSSAILDDEWDPEEAAEAALAKEVEETAAAAANEATAYRTIMDAQAKRALARNIELQNAAATVAAAQAAEREVIITARRIAAEAEVAKAQALVVAAHILARAEEQAKAEAVIAASAAATAKLTSEKKLAAAAAAAAVIAQQYHDHVSAQYEEHVAAPALAAAAAAKAAAAADVLLHHDHHVAAQYEELIVSQSIHNLEVTCGSESSPTNGGSGSGGGGVGGGSSGSSHVIQHHLEVTSAGSNRSSVTAETLSVVIKPLSPPPPPPPPPPPSSSVPVSTLASVTSSLPTSSMLPLSIVLSSSPIANITSTSAPAPAPVTLSSSTPLLPPGWASKCSKSTGKTFYYHSVTKATAWSLGEIPGFETSIIATSSPVPAPAPAPIVVSSSINTTNTATVQTGVVKPNDVTLPQGWSAKVSKSTGKSFYYHAVTKATVWSVNDIPGYTAAVPVLTKVLVTPASPPNALVSPVKVTPASPPVVSTNALVSPVKLTADESLLPLPTGWTNRSSSSGKLFYYHAATKQTSWVRPVVV